MWFNCRLGVQITSVEVIKGKNWTRPSCGMPRQRRAVGEIKGSSADDQRMSTENGQNIFLVEEKKM